MVNSKWSLGARETYDFTEGAAALAAAQVGQRGVRVGEKKSVVVLREQEVDGGSVGVGGRTLKWGGGKFGMRGYSAMGR